MASWQPKSCRIEPQTVFGYTLAPDGDGTTLTVVGTGFGQLDPAGPAPDHAAPDHAAEMSVPPRNAAELSFSPPSVSRAAGRMGG